MNYINFIEDKNVLLKLQGSTDEFINKAEIELGHKIPMAVREYLQITGESADLYSIWDYHGTKDLKYIKEWLYEWIERYRSEGMSLDEIKNVLPFFKWQDTFFYVPIEDGNENPPVYAFDINEMPTIRKLSDSFTEFVRYRYNKLMEEA